MGSLAFCFTKHKKEGRFLFESIRNSEAPDRVYAISDPEDARRFVFPIRYNSPNHRTHKTFEYFEAIPEHVVSAIRGERAILLIDSSPERTHLHPVALTALHQRLDMMGISARRVVFLTQNTDTKEDYARWIVEQGRTEMMTVFVYHYFLRGLANFVLANMIPSGEFQRRRDAAIGSIGNPVHRKRRFLSLNYTPRGHRIATMLYLLNKGLLDQGYVSFPGLQNKKYSLVGRENHVLKQVPFPDLPRLMERLPDLLARSPMILDTDPFAQTNPVIDVGESWYYLDSYVSLVTESGIRPSGKNRSFTEKPFKAMLGLQPFLVMGIPFNLEEIRAYGFRTFSPQIDESYDHVVDASVRVEMLLNELSRLCAMSDPEIHSLYEELFPSVLFNYDRFAGGVQSHFSDSIEAPMLDTIRGMLE